MNGEIYCNGHSVSDEDEKGKIEVAKAGNEAIRFRCYGSNRCEKSRQAVKNTDRITSN